MAQLISGVENIQGGYALVAAAFVTGIWAWIAQKQKNKGDNERSELSSEAQDRQNLMSEYREANRLLQERINTLHEQIAKLWTTINDLQKAVEVCERSRIDDIRRIIELESKVLNLRPRDEDSYRDGNC